MVGYALIAMSLFSMVNATMIAKDLMKDPLPLIPGDTEVRLP